jgi:hypothetical protein
VLLSEKSNLCREKKPLYFKIAMHRPISIRVLSILFFLAPLGVILFNSVLGMIPLYGYGSIWVRLTLSDYLILSLYPLTAYAIFQIRPWGWWWIIISAIVLVSYNILAFFQTSFVTMGTMISMNLLLFGFAGLFFRKHIIAPYFTPNLRWWEQDPRYDDQTYARILETGDMLLIDNISAGGCYLVSDSKIEFEGPVELELFSGKIHIRLKAKLVRTIEQGVYGYGFMFSRTSTEEKTGLEKFLEKLRSIHAESEGSSDHEDRKYTRFDLGYQLHIKKAESSQGEIHASHGAFIDISQSGASVHSLCNLKTGDLVHVHLNFHHQEFALPSKIIWSSHRDPIPVYGLHFETDKRIKRKVIQNMIRELKKIGAYKESGNRQAYLEKCEEAFVNTPIGKLGKILGG